MECELSDEYEMKDSNTSPRNLQISEMLKLIFDYPDAEKEMQNMLSNFWEKYKDCISENEDYCESDVLSMYTLDYVYKKNGPTISAVSRSIYCYLKQLNISRENRNAMINCTKSCCKKVLREFTNFESPEGEDVLIDALIKSLLNGNLGLSQLLVKFQLIEFPSEANEKSRKIVGRLVKWFISMYSSSSDESIPEAERVSLVFDDLFNQMVQLKTTGFRRLIFILCSICIIAEYKKVDELEKRFNLDAFSKYMKGHCFRKLICLDLFMKTTTESLITIKDIYKFLSTILNRQINEEIRMSFLAITKKMFCEKHDYYNPRSLKHLVRCKIRKCLQNSPVLPQSVYQLPIPVALKEFVAFEENEMWKALKDNQEIFFFEQKILPRIQT